MKHEKFLLTVILLGCLEFISAQEALKSTEEEYYDFLALRGIAERPTLNYRTLSDSLWEIPGDAAHPWQNINLGTKRALSDNVLLRIYGPEQFMSYNTAVPYGQNDGALWQGKGFNSSLTAGVRLEGYGVELTFKPQLAFSQNLAFDYVQPAYLGAAYADKAADYGYYGIPSIDAPQRFGNEPFFTYDWGDSEIRYTWKTLTVGFGTQAIWLGPGRVNSTLHSNNAPAYPKLDIGIRRQRVTIPWINWYLGDIEARLWAGYLSESNYFDNDSTNDHNLITAFSVAYAPSFLPGLTLFANRNFLTKWDGNIRYIQDLFMYYTQDAEDQRLSIGADYLLPLAGIEVYGELGINDFTDSVYPHTMVYMVGLRKEVPLFLDYLKGELLFEWSNLEMSQDFQFQWPSTFYAHHQITQGYTNGGQWLGAGIGTGGNSQYLGFKVYYPKGYGLLFASRVNPDNDYVYKDTINTIIPKPLDGGTPDGFFSFKKTISVGIKFSYFIYKNIHITGGFTYQEITNPYYTVTRDLNAGEKDLIHQTKQNNFSIDMKVEMFF